MDKDELRYILEGFHGQVVAIIQCIDSVIAMQEIGGEKLKVAPHFFSAAQDAFIFRYSVELCKLLVEEKGKKPNGDITIYRICDLVKANSTYFSNEFDVIAMCDTLLSDIGNYKSTIANLKKRRNKTYGHSDKEYYNYSKKAIDDFPLDFDKIKDITNLLYNFSMEILYSIESKLPFRHLIHNSDDIKKLFGMPTHDESFYKKLLEDWNSKDKETNAIEKERDCNADT